MSPQITLFARGLAPNPIKITILLEQLKLDYVIVQKEMGDVPNGMKRPDFLEINPNGRVPAIIDHTNKDHKVWESGAILLYLAERFDPTGAYIGKTLEERCEVWEWLIFQVSGLGPIQGQVNWFMHFHTIKDLHPSVLERYRNETYRVWGVLDKRLADTGSYFALNKFTVADMAIYPWIQLAYFAELDVSKFPSLDAYFKRLQELPAVKEAYVKMTPPGQS